MTKQALFTAISFLTLAAALAGCGDRDEVPSTAADAVEQEDEDAAPMAPPPEPEPEPGETAATEAAAGPEPEPGSETETAAAAPAVPADFEQAAAMRAAAAVGAAEAEGAYEEGDLSALWTAWFDEEGELLKVVEDQSLGEYGGSRVEIVYDETGRPLRFTETGERALTETGLGDGMADFSKTFYFENGEMIGGVSDQDGTAGRPGEREVFAATQLALDARERALASGTREG